MKADASIFAFDPVLGCPFDDSEMKMVEEWNGFKIGMQVDVSKTPNKVFRGKIAAIGENAKYLHDGELFVAFMITIGDRLLLATHKQIYHVL